MVRCYESWTSALRYGQHGCARGLLLLDVESMSNRFFQKISPLIHFNIDRKLNGRDCRSSSLVLSAWSSQWMDA
jgi:hypothetical protein